MRNAGLPKNPPASGVGLTVRVEVNLPANASAEAYDQTSVVRSVGSLSDTSARADLEHPSEQRDIHDDFPSDVRRLIDKAHFAQATLEAFKFIEEEVQRCSGSNEFGRKLMFDVFNESTPALTLNPKRTTSQIGEQE